MDNVVLTIDVEKVENLKEQTVETIEILGYFRSLCQRYKVPVDDLQEINEALVDETLVSSIRQEQLKKHPLNGQVASETLKLPEKIESDIQEIEDYQKQFNTSYASRRFITPKLEVDVKAINEACSVFGSDRAKIGLEKITKASELINAVRGKTSYGDRIHSFTRLFTTDLKGQIIPNVKIIQEL